MAPQMNAQQQAQMQAQQNHQLRQAFVASGVRSRKKLGTLTGNPGDTVRQKLFNVGVITKLLIDVTLNVTIGTANAVQSLKGPYNFLSRVRLTDFDGTDRVNLSGWQLFVLNCKRHNTFYGANNENSTAVLVNPNYPVATGAKAIQFIIEVPVAFDPDNPIVELIDMRGAIMAQTAVGEMYLNIDTNASLVSVAGDIDSLFSGAGTTTVVNNGGFSMVIYQDYILPQTPPGMNQPPMPFLDLITVYENVGNVKSSDNLAVNTPKIMSYPNARSVVGAFYSYVTAGSAAMGNITSLQLVANGNNILLDNTERTQMFNQRLFLNSDIAPGVFFNNHEEHPIETALFGNIQEYLTPAVVSGGNQYVEYAYESFFLKGQALPGFNQAS
jgi:hypothetical protein